MKLLLFPGLVLPLSAWPMVEEKCPRDGRFGGWTYASLALAIYDLGVSENRGP